MCQPLPQVHTSGRQKGLSLVPSNGCGRPSPDKSLRSEQEVSLWESPPQPFIAQMAELTAIPAQAQALLRNELPQPPALRGMGEACLLRKGLEEPRRTGAEFCTSQS